jgi:hypothetical protein
MTVKIIEGPAKQVTCRNCGVTLEYVPTDTEEGIRDGEAYRFIMCPHCNAVVVVKP